MLTLETIEVDDHWTIMPKNHESTESKVLWFFTYGLQNTVIWRVVWFKGLLCLKTQEQRFKIGGIGKCYKTPNSPHKIMSRSRNANSIFWPFNFF